MDTLLTEEQLEFYEDRKKAVEEQDRLGKKYALLTNIEFKRVIMHIEGSLKALKAAMAYLPDLSPRTENLCFTLSTLIWKETAFT